jgi:fido (protein-threonine AMPylation protein)
MTRDDLERLSAAALSAATSSLVLCRLERAEGDPRRLIPGEAELSSLHHVGAVFRLDRPGRYRTNEVEVAKADVVVFRAPPHARVRPLMRSFFRELPGVWAAGDPLDVAAHVLWRITRIHPFRDGNGRAACAFAYACLCLKLGALLPGRPSVFEALMEDRAGCEAALRAVDLSAEDEGATADLGPLKAHLDRLLLDQVRSVEPGQATPGVTG